MRVVYEKTRRAQLFGPEGQGTTLQVGSLFEFPSKQLLEWGR